MGDQAFVSMYRAEFAKLTKSDPAYADPFSAKVDALAFIRNPKFAKLGALCAINGDLATSRAWFRFAHQASLEGFAAEARKVRGWPDDVEGPTSTTFRITASEAALFGRLAFPHPSSEPWSPSLRPALRWLGASTGKVVLDLIETDPSTSQMPESNSVAMEFRSQLLLPAVVLRDAHGIHLAADLLEKLDEWHRRISPNPKVLTQHEFVFPAVEDLARALLANDRDQFVPALGNEARRLNALPKGEAYKRSCHPETFAVYLEGTERFGSLRHEGVLGIPPTLDPAAYWLA